jgi:hypothetical protein
MKSSSGNGISEGPGGLAIAILIVCMLVGTGLGVASWGMLGGLLGVLAGSSLGLMAYVVLRARSNRGGLSDGKAPDVRGLPPEQALNVLSAMVGKEGGGMAFGSAILNGVAEIREQAESDLHGAIAALEALGKEHPRSPAIPAELAKLHARAEDQASSLACSSEAITLGIRGGMNAMAARAFEDLGEISEAHEHLDLDQATRDRLGKALAARGNAAGAAWCRR